MILSIDIETTGLSPLTCQTIEIAIVAEVDKTTPVEQLPRYVCLVKHDLYQGEAYALQMNKSIFEELAGIEITNVPQYTPAEVVDTLDEWLGALDAKRKFTVVGKNFGSFDRLFLAALGVPVNKYFRHRYLDVGALFWDPEVDGDNIPDMSKCMLRAGIDTIIEHRALTDAMDTMKLLRIYEERRRVCV